MAETATIAVQGRDRAGKGAARATRRAGLIPAVVYGEKLPPVTIALDPRHLLAEMRKPGFSTRVLTLVQDEDRHTVLTKDVQWHPVTDQPMHVDFLRISKDTELTVQVPVRFINETLSPGLKIGGVLNIVRHDVEVNCTQDNLPTELVVDLTGAKINDSIHISAVKLPTGVTPTITDRDFTIATIVAPSGLRSEAEGEGGGE